MNLASDELIDPRLDEVLADYLKTQSQGDSSNRQTWISRHPSLAPALQAFFADLDHVDQVTAPLRQALNPGPSWRGKNIGAYLVQDELGAGGMGVVYLAQHTQMERRAALKILRAGSWATRDELQRFHSEIQAIVALDHPNIIPIYDVGEHEGVPYYSMKLVEGGSLAGWLAERKRQLANWPIGLPDHSIELAEFLLPVCEAIHHAHQRGILHRDLKPSNILLDWKAKSGPDDVHDLASALPYVADFGLAKRLERTDAQALTQTGHILGTPSYMAPEQASGRGGAATIAADVYSLGAILYELLAGRPPFRQDTPAQTLRDVMETEPPAPRPLNPAIASDLETICLKCLDKDPNRRYSTAAALAEDLEAFIQGEPIQARPLGRWEKLLRWRRRQPVLAALTLALTVSVLAGFALTTWQWLRSEGYRREAEQHLEAIQRERSKEEQSFRQAHRAVKEFSCLLGDDLEQLPGMQPLRKKTLETARAYFEEFLKTRSEDKNLRGELADAHLSLGDIARQIQAKHEAVQYYQKALASFRELAAAHPGEEEWPLKIGLAQQNIGVLLRYTGDPTAALTAFTEARDLYKNTSFSPAARRQARKELAFVLLHLGGIHGDAARWQEAFALTQQACDVYRDLLSQEPKDKRLRADLARCLHNLGVFHQRCDDKEESLSAFDEACALRAELAKENPLEFDNHLAVAKHHLGVALKSVGRTEEARAANQEAMDLREKLVRDNPKVLWYRIGLAASCMNAGVEHKESGRADLALPFFLRAAELLEPLASEDPKTVQVHLDLVRAWTHLGNEMAHLGKDREALKYFDLARTRAEQLVRQDDERLECRQSLAHALFFLAKAHKGQNRWEETRTAIRQALVVQKPLLKRASESIDYCRQRSTSLMLAAEAERALRHWQDAAAFAREFASLWPKRHDKLFEAAAELAKTARAAAWAKATKDALRCAEYSLEVLRQAKGAGFRNFAALRDDPDWEVVRRLPGFAELAK